MVGFTYRFGFRVQWLINQLSRIRKKARNAERAALKPAVGLREIDFICELGECLTTLWIVTHVPFAFHRLVDIAGGVGLLLTIVPHGGRAGGRISSHRCTPYMGRQKHCN